MNRTGRFVLGVAVVLGAVMGLHIRLIQAGFVSFWKRLTCTGAPVR